MLVDSHCHLDLLVNKTNDSLSDIITRANKNGVNYMQTICTKLDDFPNILKIAEEFEAVYASVGVHPTDAIDTLSYLDLIKLSEHVKVIGLGETGLDYYHDSTRKKQQKHSFLQHIIASQSNALPVIVHTREAEEDTIDIITTEMRNSPFPGLIHCFTASKHLAQKMLDLGMYISISGIITFKNADHLREIVKFLPLDRLLIETDSPYLAPVPMRSSVNEPSFVEFVATAIADLKNISKMELAQQTTDNFFKLFNKAQEARKFKSSPVLSDVLNNMISKDF
ncbi:TatD family deoxyribonuclease [Candidatus Trichorickettsia mobilis]|uniref:TatD family deoxyribonuclease n=1 Tax=Candidatus Trichorickettsia mobilis TaxID=1346319 RepID=A0ABZ0USJ5_9RICK|nr:TatD family hydrolase [Candidatus Trichorickettsia mobilis]WPY00175.1 TatD family deoxyribonuclease [Candidatus Trichorickettsia mobilis]